MNLPAISVALMLPIAPPGSPAEEPAMSDHVLCADPTAPESMPGPEQLPLMVPRIVPTLPSEQTSGDEAQDAEIVIVARGAPPPGDPLQEANVESYKVVQAIDGAIVGPVASAYEKGLPKPVRKGVGNALRNLGEPVNFLNFLFQLKIGKAAETAGRFMVNSTVGVAGLFDVAKKKPFNLPYRANGFANTLGYYGVKPGAYLYLPLVGPTSVRDLVGDSLDLLVLPTAIGKPFNKAAYAIPTTTIRQLNDRVENDEEIRRLRETSADPYAETRSLYLEMREREIGALRYPAAVDAAPDAATPTALPVPPAADQPGSDGEEAIEPACASILDVSRDKLLSQAGTTGKAD